jgi:hypothetical protein
LLKKTKKKKEKEKKGELTRGPYFGRSWSSPLGILASTTRRKMRKPVNALLCLCTFVYRDNISGGNPEHLKALRKVI